MTHDFKYVFNNISLPNLFEIINTNRTNLCLGVIKTNKHKSYNLFSL